MALPPTKHKVHLITLAKSFSPVRRGTRQSKKSNDWKVWWLIGQFVKENVQLSVIWSLCDITVISIHDYGISHIFAWIISVFTSLCYVTNFVTYQFAKEWWWMNAQCIIRIKGEIFCLCDVFKKCVNYRYWFGGNILFYRDNAIKASGLFIHLPPHSLAKHINFAKENISDFASRVLHYASLKVRTHLTLIIS